MRVKYQTRTISKTFSTNGGTAAEMTAFFRDIANALIDMGAPLNAELSCEYSGALSVPLIGEACGEMGGASFYMEPYANEGSTDIYMSLDVYGRNDPDIWGNHYYAEDVLIGGTNSKNFQISIHAVKSGDSFFFGFIPAGGSTGNGCISYAITPMRRLSDPSVSLGYAVVEGVATHGGTDMFAGGMFNRTLPFVEGFNYNNGMFNFTSTGYAHAFPETDTGKIPLVPYFAGIEDIYYDKVYVSPMLRGMMEEKAFETDKGTFLIGGSYGVDHTQACYNTFAFDITEAVNSAQ